MSFLDVIQPRRKCLACGGLGQTQAEIQQALDAQVPYYGVDIRYDSDYSTWSVENVIAAAATGYHTARDAMAGKSTAVANAYALAAYWFWRTHEVATSQPYDAPLDVAIEEYRQGLDLLMKAPLADSQAAAGDMSKSEEYLKISKPGAAEGATEEEQDTTPFYKKPIVIVGGLVLLGAIGYVAWKEKQQAAVQGVDDSMDGLIEAIKEG